MKKGLLFFCCFVGIITNGFSQMDGGTIHYSRPEPQQPMQPAQPTQQPNQGPGAVGDSRGSSTHQNPQRVAAPKPTAEQIAEQIKKQEEEKRQNDENQLKAQAEQKEQQLKSSRDYYDAFHDQLRQLEIAGIDAEYKKAIDSRAHNIQQMKDLIVLKQDLIEEMDWHTSDMALLVGMVASTITATTERMNELLSLVGKETHIGLPQKATIVTATYSYQIALEAAKKFEFNERLVEEAIKEQLKNDGITHFGKVAEFTASLYNLGINMKETYSDMPAQQKELRNEVNSQLKALDKAIKECEDKIAKSNRLIETKNNLHKAIQDYRKTQSPRP